MYPSTSPEEVPAVDFRLALSTVRRNKHRWQMLCYALLLISRFAFVSCCAGVIGGSVAMMTLRAQSRSVEERLFSNEFKQSASEIELQQLKVTVESQDRRINEQDNAISRMEGIGVGLAAILIVLQVLQSFMGRNIVPRNDL